MTITPLPFDSSLFGYPVGKCQVEKHWDEENFLLLAKDYQVVYIFSRDSLRIRSDHVHLADTKLTFEKALQDLGNPDSGIFPYSGEGSVALLNLALQSGVYSRFATDPGFTNGEYEKLYARWIQNAIDQKEVLLTEAQEGLVSCQLSGTKARIGLLAIDQNHRGKGWGKRLVKAAENLAVQKGAKSMIIGTQQANIPACKLYQSLGYQLHDKTHIYHWWQ